MAWALPPSLVAAGSVPVEEAAMSWGFAATAGLTLSPPAVLPTNSGYPDPEAPVAVNPAASWPLTVEASALATPSSCEWYEGRYWLMAASKPDAVPPVVGTSTWLVWV